jgi:hypothetical protein
MLTCSYAWVLHPIPTDRTPQTMLKELRQLPKEIKIYSEPFVYISDYSLQFYIKKICEISKLQSSLEGSAVGRNVK